MYIKEKKNKEEEKGSCVCGKRINKYKFFEGQRNRNKLLSEVSHEEMRGSAQ